MQALAHEPVDRVVHVGVLRERLEVARLEGPAEHRSDREQLPQVLGQPADPLLDRLLDRRRERVRRDLRLPGEAPLPGVVAGDAPGVEQRPHQLLGEEQVALRGLEEPLDQASGELRAADERLDERAVLGGRERPERDVAEAAVAAEAVEHARERVAIVHLGRAVAADDQRRRRTEAGDDVRERLDRGLGPVQVLEEQDQRPAAGDPRQRPREQLEDLRLVLERGGRLRARPGRRPSRRSGSRGSRAASGTARAGRPRDPRSRAAARSPCPSPGSAPGRSRRNPGTAKARSRSTERPCSTRICRALASFSSSSSSRVLPIPGSPPTTTNWRLAGEGGVQSPLQLARTPSRVPRRGPAPAAVS